MYEIDHARLIEMNVSRAQQASRDGGAIWETQESKGNKAQCLHDKIL